MATIAIGSIRTDGGTQTRERLDRETVESYADAIKSGAEFPPIVVFYDGASYWLADGFHRLDAYVFLGRPNVEADVRQGDKRAAILHSVGANSAHGLQRKNADKRRAVMTLLADEEWRAKSDRWIAEKCGVSHPLVGELRRELEAVTSSTPRIGQDGKTRKMPDRGSAVRVEASNDDDEEEDVPDEVFEAPDAPPIPREVERTGWGSADVSAHVFKIISACKESEARISALYDGADARFSQEIRQRCQDTVLRLMRSLDSLLPPDGRRADENRKTFGVVTGGKK